MNSNKQIKSIAKDSLRGKYAFPICGYLFIYFLTSTISTLCSSFLGELSTYTIVLGQAITFVILLIMTVFDAGLDYMFLNLARNKPCTLQDVFYMIHHQPDRVIIVGSIFTLVNYLCNFPQVIFSYFILPKAASYTQLIEPLLITTMASLALYVLSFVITIPIAFSYNLLIDNPQMNALDALKGSISMLNGYKLRLFKLELSFLGLGILGILSMGIAFLWIYPYMKTTLARFYDELRTSQIIIRVA